MAKQAKYDQNSTKHGKHNQKATVYDKTKSLIPTRASNNLCK